MIKENEASRTRTEAVNKMKDEWDAIIGKDRERIQVEADLRTAQNSLLSLQEQLTLATINGNAAAIAGLSQQITMQSQLNAHKARTKQLAEQSGVLSGAITGFDNGVPTYADAYQREQAATGYQSPSGGGKANNNDYWAPQPYSLNYVPKLATGTNRVPADGYAFLHKDEAVVPAKYNPAVNGQSSDAAITIQSAQFILPNVTNQTSASELFRQLTPMLDKYNDRTKRRG